MIKDLRDIDMSVEEGKVLIVVLATLMCTDEFSSKTVEDILEVANKKVKEIFEKKS